MEGHNRLLKQAGDRQITQLTEADSGTFAVSAEKLLALEMLSKNTGKLHTEIRSLKDGSPLKTFGFESRRQTRFTPDGKNTAYDAMQGEAGQIIIQPLDSAESFVLTAFQNDEFSAAIGRRTAETSPLLAANSCAMPC